MRVQSIRLRGPTCIVGRLSVSATRLRQVLPVAGNYLLIPGKRLFPAACQRAIAFIIFIDINKAVAFSFPRAGGNQIDTAPGCSPSDRRHPRPPPFHLRDMGGEIIDAILVIDAAVRFADINRAKAVFDNKQRQLVVIPEPVQRIAQTDRVNLPAPVRLLTYGLETVLVVSS